MVQGNSSVVPNPTDHLRRWEAYFRNAVESKSACRVRKSHLHQTVGQREQTYLGQLRQSIESILPNNSLTQQGHALQRQVLELIKLRRRFAADDSPALQNAEAFLAIVQIHQAIKSLLERIENLLQVYSQLEPKMNEVHETIQLISSGRLYDGKAISPVIQSIRDIADDPTIHTEDWLKLSYRIAKFDIKYLQPAQRLALASAMQSCFLAARIFRKQTLNQKSPTAQLPHQQKFGIQPESFLVASLLKDVGIWLQTESGSSTAKIHHAEISAGLVSRLSGLQIGTTQIVRQHHECLDGSGLPLGIRKSGLHAESRLLAVLTRWTELYNQHLYQIENSDSLPEEFSPTEQSSNMLIQEMTRNRWEKLSTDLLLDVIDVCELKEIAQPRYKTNAKPSWQVPRPYFLDATRKSLSVAAVRKKAFSSN